MMKEKIAILSSNVFENKIQEDILLKNELLKYYDCEIISWEKVTEKNVHSYSAFIVKSIWGYHKNYLKFMNLIKYIHSNKIPIFNSYDNIMFDISKKNQYKFLISYNIDTIPTVFLSDYLKNKKHELLNCEKLVAKPSISASGEMVTKITKKDIDSLKEIYKDTLIDENQDILIQPFIENVTRGELSCVIVNDTIRYVIKRFPGIFTEEKSINYCIETNESIKNFVNPIIKELKKFELLFYRIDLIENNDSYLVVELEMIDPDLFIRNVPINIQQQTVKAIVDELNYRINIKRGKNL